MSRILPIIRREYIARITSRAFWISTALFPLLTFLMTVLPSLMAERSKSAPEPVAIVDQTGKFFPVLQDVVAHQKKEGDAPDTPIQKRDAAGVSTVELTRKLNRECESGALQGYFIIDEKALQNGELTFFARNPTSGISNNSLQRVVSRAVTKYRLMQAGYSGAAVDRAVERVSIDVKKATNDPKKQESGVAAFFMSFGLVMFIYFALIIYGIYVLQGVLEEKTSRIVEVIVSSVTPFQLMMGKILGICAVGLTQIGIWVASALILTAPQLAAALSISKDMIPTPSAPMLIFFPIYFILGFFLYSSIYAGIGSMFNSMEDAQQMASTANMLLIVPMLFLTVVIKNPNGPLSTVLSLIPFFSPVLMYLRIATQFPPLWQIGLSIAIMLASIVVMIWLVSKIYRVGILMYGKKPTLPEVMRWLKYT